MSKKFLVVWFWIVTCQHAFLPYMNPLLLLLQAPLCIFSLMWTYLGPLYLYIPSKALYLSIYFCNFLLLYLGICLCPFLLSVLGPLVSKATGLKCHPFLLCFTIGLSHIFTPHVYSWAPVLNLLKKSGMIT